MSAGNPRFFDVIVCDDVREELGNKRSLMGIYENAIVLDAFPALLPRLCFVMKARTPGDRPFESLTFVVKRDDEVIIQTELHSEQLAAIAREEAPSLPDGASPEPADSAIKLTAVMVLSPITFEKPCRLRFRAITESEELRGGNFFVTNRHAGPKAVRSNEPAVS
ncbi:MAG: hypothetical protein AMXMBFR45_01750 [Gammaproteobacteria bacterium]|nr:MAG: hypothetical protein EDM71_04505 [Pseudomonadota bacterium]MBC6945396.1 hypothetical protein [Gammaproteobacteria bacterium]MDL1881083.1 hypothetical protein [Gammaproteobacteria bacterium PRO2]GIK35881.1 MAG: hypothetical protein BroJett010_24400 [Gammaproteobacteria bacterium]